jgi:hypothetical protein
VSPRKAIRWKSGEGYTVKRRARKIHECTQCDRDILANEEYYQLNYYKGTRTYPICEKCWKGPKLSAQHKTKYRKTYEEASEVKPEKRLS